jgi:hypothetical protein
MQGFPKRNPTASQREYTKAFEKSKSALAELEQAKNDVILALQGTFDGEKVGPNFLPAFVSHIGQENFVDALSDRLEVQVGMGRSVTELDNLATLTEETGTVLVWAENTEWAFVMLLKDYRRKRATFMQSMFKRLWFNLYSLLRLEVPMDTQISNMRKEIDIVNVLYPDANLKLEPPHPDPRNWGTSEMVPLGERFDTITREVEKMNEEIAKDPELSYLNNSAFVIGKKARVGNNDLLPSNIVTQSSASNVLGGNNTVLRRMLGNAVYVERSGITVYVSMDVWFNYHLACYWDGTPTTFDAMNKAFCYHYRPTDAYHTFYLAQANTLNSAMTSIGQPFLASGKEHEPLTAQVVLQDLFPALIPRGGERPFVPPPPAPAPRSTVAARSVVLPDAPEPVYAPPTQYYYTVRVSTEWDWEGDMDYAGNYPTQAYDPNKGGTKLHRVQVVGIDKSFYDAAAKFLKEMPERLADIWTGAAERDTGLISSGAYRSWPQTAFLARSKTGQMSHYANNNLSGFLLGDMGLSKRHATLIVEAAYLMSERWVEGSSYTDFVSGSDWTSMVDTSLLTLANRAPKVSKVIIHEESVETLAHVDSIVGYLKSKNYLGDEAPVLDIPQFGLQAFDETGKTKSSPFKEYPPTEGYPQFMYVAYPVRVVPNASGELGEFYRRFLSPYVNMPPQIFISKSMDVGHDLRSDDQGNPVRHQRWVSKQVNRSPRAAIGVSGRRYGRSTLSVSAQSVAIEDYRSTPSAVMPVTGGGLMTLPQATGATLAVGSMLYWVLRR